MTTYLTNRKARFQFELLTSYEAGLVLFGHEVKSIRAGNASLEGSYVVLRGGEAFLLSAHISPYQTANTPREYEPDRARKLLLSRSELQRLDRELNTAGLTLIPLELYNKGGKIKLKIALARGKKKQDKRETLKQRASQRDIDRLLKTVR